MVTSLHSGGRGLALRGPLPGELEQQRQTEVERCWLRLLPAPTGVGEREGERCEGEGERLLQLIGSCQREKRERRWTSGSRREARRREMAPALRHRGNDCRDGGR